MTINQSDCQIQSHDSGSLDSVIGNITLCLAMFDVSVFSWYAATHNCCQTWTHNAMIIEHRQANPSHCQCSQTLLPCTAEFQIIKENTHDIDIIADKPKRKWSLLDILNCCLLLDDTPQSVCRLTYQLCRPPNEGQELEVVEPPHTLATCWLHAVHSL